MILTHMDKMETFRIEDLDLSDEPEPDNYKEYTDNLNKTIKGLVPYWLDILYMSWRFGFNLGSFQTSRRIRLYIGLWYTDMSI